MSSTSSKAQRIRSRGVKRASERGREAIVGLTVMAVVRVVSVGISSWQIGLLDEIERGAPETPMLHVSDTLVALTAVAELALLLITGVLFLRWLAATVRVARVLQVSPSLAWTPSQAVWGFFIPFVNLARPYQVLRDLRDRLAPDGVPEPAPQPRLDGAAGYRTVEFEKAPPPAKLPHAFIGAWWALYLLGGLVQRGATSSTTHSTLERIGSRKMSVAADVIELGSTVLAILVVTAISARVTERQRRLRHATDEELTSWGIDP
jgi:hypothetical protein